MSRLRSSWCLALAALIAATGGVARGDDPALAAQLLLDGTRAYNAGDFKSAIADYQRSYKLAGQPLALYDLAQAYRLDGDRIQAEYAYRSFLRHDAAHPDLQAAARRQLDALAPAPSSSPASEPSAPPVVAPAALPGATPSRPQSPGAAPWYDDRAGLALAGGGVLVAVTGIVLWLHGEGLASDALADPDLVRGDQRYSSAIAWRSAGLSALLTGAALAGAGGARLVWTYRARSTARIGTLRFAAAPGGLALGVGF